MFSIRTPMFKHIFQKLTRSLETIALEYIISAQEMKALELLSLILLKQKKRYINQHKNTSFCAPVLGSLITKIIMPNWKDSNKTKTTINLC